MWRSADGLNACIFKYAAQLLGELFYEFRELRSLLKAILEQIVLEILLPRRGLRQAAEEIFPEHDHITRYIGRPDDAADDRIRGKIESRLLECRNLGKRRQPPVGYLHQDAHVARPDMLACLLRIDDHH